MKWGRKQRVKKKTLDMLYLPIRNGTPSAVSRILRIGAGRSVGGGVCMCVKISTTPPSLHLRRAYSHSKIIVVLGQGSWPRPGRGAQSILDTIQAAKLGSVCLF